MNKVSTTAAAIAACAACCVPVIWPVLAGFGATEMLAGVLAWLHRWPIDIVFCASVAIALAGLAIWAQRRHSLTAFCDCESVCDIASAAPKDQA